MEGILGEYRPNLRLQPPSLSVNQLTGNLRRASHGFIVGHITPEAAVGGPIAVVKTGDVITIDAKTNGINMDVPDQVIQERLKSWTPPSKPVTRGVLAKYAHLVGDASHGAMTDQF